jgi:hypothetical protein
MRCHEPVTYIGCVETPGGEKLDMYTDAMTETSFVVHPGELMWDALQRARRPYGKTISQIPDA